MTVLTGMSSYPWLEPSIPLISGTILRLPICAAAHRPVDGEQLAHAAPGANRCSRLRRGRSERALLERLADLVALDVVGRVARDADVVIVDEQLEVQVARHGQPGGLGVVSSCWRLSHPSMNTVLPWLVIASPLPGARRGPDGRRTEVDDCIAV
jgi:hypothetical protein